MHLKEKKGWGEHVVLSTINESIVRKKWFMRLIVVSPLRACRNYVILCYLE